MCTLNHEMCFNENGVYKLGRKCSSAGFGSGLFYRWCFFGLMDFFLHFLPGCPAILYLFSCSTVKYKVFKVSRELCFIFLYFLVEFFGFIFSFSFMGFYPPGFSLSFTGFLPRWCLGRVICSGQNMPPPPLAGTTYHNNNLSNSHF